MTIQNVFGSTPPSSINISGDSDVIVLGHVFKVGQAGQVLGLRYYEGEFSNTVSSNKPKIGVLWDISGTLLAQKTFDLPVADGWQEKNFTVAYPVSANTPYVMSVFFDLNNWSANVADLLLDKVSGDITLYGYLNDPASIGQGRYNDSGSLLFPGFASGGHSSYGVDVMFQVNAPPPPPTPNTIDLLSRNRRLPLDLL